MRGIIEQTSRRRPWSPHVIRGSLALWLDAADAGSTIPGVTGLEQWLDKSTLGNHAVQASGPLQPTLATAALNGLPGMRFASQYLTGSATLGSACSVFVVARLHNDAVTSKRALVFAAAGATDQAAGGLAPAMQSVSANTMRTNYNASQTTTGSVVFDSAFMFGTVFDGTGASTRKNAGTASTNASVPSIAVTRYCVGANLLSASVGVQYWSDDIYEIIVASVALADEYRQKVEGYLAHKWRPSILPADHPYANSPP